MITVNKLPEVGTKEWGNLIENEFAIVEIPKKPVSSYKEIIEALEWYLGDGVTPLSSDCIYEIINQEHDPIETIANALDAFRGKND